MDCNRGGDGRREKKHRDAKSILEAIRSSSAIEDRVALVVELIDLQQLETDELVLVIESLPTLWDESICPEMCQCTLNKGILHLAMKYLELEFSHYASQFIILGTKVSVWCRSHIEATFTSVGIEGQQQDLFLQLILDSLSFSSSMICFFTNSPFFGDVAVMLNLENLILEHINLTRDLVTEIKRNHSIAAAVLKVIPVVLDAVIKLSRSYCEALKYDKPKSGIENSQAPVDKRLNFSVHAVNIHTFIIRSLYDLGKLAASGGGNLVTVLNASWKGVVTLLQLGKGFLYDNIHVGDIILTIVSLATDSLSCAVETWSTASKGVTISEAKRVLFPAKFYLINAVRISSEYPCEALGVSSAINKLVLLISSFGSYFIKVNHLRVASEALSEVVEPSSFLLMCTILNSTSVKLESKLQILDKLFSDESISEITWIFLGGSRNSTHQSSKSVGDDNISEAETLILGRVMLFLIFLKNSALLREDMVLEISRKLGYLLRCVLNEDVYSSLLLLHVPVSSTSGATTTVAWEPLISFLLHVLKTFMIVASSSALAWKEVEIFLLQNIFHAHVVCVEIVQELWCFLIRHAEQEMVVDALDSLCSLLKIVALSRPDLAPFSSLRKIARFIATLVSCAPQTTTVHVYKSVFADEKFILSSVSIALLMEGFPLHSLPNHLKDVVVQKILDAYFSFMDNDGGTLVLSDSSGFSNLALLGLPIQTLSHAVHCCQIDVSGEFDSDRVSLFLKFSVSVIREFLHAAGKLKDHYSLLLGAILEIVSSMKHFYVSKDMYQVILELRTIFLDKSSPSDSILAKCKVPLTSFLAGLGEMEIEGNSASAYDALLDLYHILLKERHWAFIHLALTAFGYFTACTSCSELWKFIPHDAALSFDMTGSETCEERFMSEFKAFLEKDTSSVDVIGPCKEELAILANEGAVLRRKVAKVLDYIAKVPEPEKLEIDYDKQTTGKKRKLPDGIYEGLALLQSGLKVLTDAFASSESEELKEKYSDHVSSIEEAVSLLFSLSNEG